MKRFDCEKSGYGKDAMEESETGEYVLYSDHLEIVEAKNRAMSALYRELNRVNLAKQKYYEELETAKGHLEALTTNVDERGDA